MVTEEIERVVLIKGAGQRKAKTCNCMQWGTPAEQYSLGIHLDGNVGRARGRQREVGLLAQRIPANFWQWVNELRFLSKRRRFPGAWG